MPKVLPSYRHFRAIPASELPGVRFGSLPDEVRCKARNRAGERCGCARVKGFKVCRMHGAGSGVSKTRDKRQAARLRGERPAHYWQD